MTYKDCTVSPLKIKTSSKNVWKTNKYTNYSCSLLIMYGSSYMFPHYIAIFRELPEDGNVMLKHVGATIHN
jgi:hypothetical protein